jgi:hypothetical protein
MPIYGLLLVALMLLRPQGLFGTRELWELGPFRKRSPSTSSSSSGGGAR